jgi:iron complex outermembrane receptor protein
LGVPLILQRVFMLKKYAAIPFAVMCLTSQLAFAEETKSLSSVVITATKTEQDSFDLPMSIDKVSKEQIQDGQLRMTLSESLARVPGITAQNRTQMAQDPQISSRGFGARSAFGVRGIRLYVDGIPLSMPDGSGNPGSIDLGMIDAIEVMRGPFSALYGSSSGGVIQMLTSKSAGPTEISADVLYGSYETLRQSVTAKGISTSKEFDYQIGISDYSSNGYRQQSKNDKQQATAKLGVKLSEDTSLTTLLNWFDQDAQDPGGLKRISDSREPSAFVSPSSIATSFGPTQANTRVSRSNTQVGANLEHKINSDNVLNLITYAGQRENLQYLSTSGTSAVGRASSISRDFYGVEAKVTNKGNWLDKNYTLTYGFNYGAMQDARLDRAATLGEITAAGQASPTRDETQKASNMDLYVQGLYALDARWDLHAGLRYSTVQLEIADKDGLPVTGSGKLDFSKTIPVAGVVYKVNPTMNVYANAGLGFETPTLVEITYADPTKPADGPNLSLVPSTSKNAELGAKFFTSDTSVLNAAVFYITTENEIVTKKLQGSTGSYKNAAETKRVGAEISFDALLPNNFSTRVAYTNLTATFESPFLNSSSKTVNAGNIIPGTYKHQAFAELAWVYPSLGFQTALNAVYNSSVQVDDTNTDNAPKFTTFNLRASLNQKSGPWSTTEYITLNNITDVKYIGSVKVNDANSRFFEPAAPFNWILGVKAAYKF